MVYFCDRRFHLEEIITLFEANAELRDAIMVVRGQDCRLFKYLVDLDRAELVGQTSGNIRNNHCRGGFSQNRYQRLREEDIHAVVEKMVDLLKRKCTDANGRLALRCLVITGPGQRKREVLNMLQKRLDVSGIFVSVLTSAGDEKKTLADAAAEVLGKVYHREIRKAEKEVKDRLERSPESLVFGPAEVRSGLDAYSLRRVYYAASLPEFVAIHEELAADAAVEMVRLPRGSFAEFQGVVGVNWY
mmetsp:Transcript_5684/g.16121  ORF Transcript_5684/g.16121 Transcript_5684/m.16121 type:complete len:245 (+) Transcript_5684:453-1187(+)